MTKTIEPLDLASLDTAAASDKGAEIELLHPTNHSPLGIFITVLGKDSEALRQYIKDDVDARLRRQALEERQGKAAHVATAQEAEDKAVEMLTVATVSWRSETYEIQKGKKVVVANEPTIKLGADTLTFSVANARKLYAEQLWVRRQIDAAIGDLENFIKG